MKYYIDITILPDAEASLDFLWRKIFQQIHLALVENKNKDNSSSIAISFPLYCKATFPLGNKLRLFALSESPLKTANIDYWLKRLKDYCHITSVKAVPIQHTFACFSRKQVKSIENKARRRAKKLNVDYKDALKFFKHKESELSCTLPFIQAVSQSTSTPQKHQNTFPLFIEKKESDVVINGSYDCYGLSKAATVPIF